MHQRTNFSSPVSAGKAPSSECAFVRVMATQLDSLKKYAIALTSNVIDAEDLVQETILRAINKKNYFVEDKNLLGWLSTIMRNIHFNNYQQLSRKRELIDSNVKVDEVATVAEGSYFTPDGAYNLNEIYREIDRLGETSRVPFKMYLTGNKYSEIAQSLGLPVGTIKSRIFFARKELQKNLEELKD